VKHDSLPTSLPPIEGNAALQSELQNSDGRKKCEYVPLSPGEIKKLKHNGFHPHDFKSRGSKDDLYKCKPSGRIIVKRKTKYFDHNKGGWAYPGDEGSEDTGININDLPWDSTMKEPLEEAVIEFRVSGYSRPPSAKVQNLKGFEQWHVGDARVPNSLLKHKTAGFRIRASQAKSAFEERVTSLVERLYEFRTEIKKLKAECQLACAFYVSGSERPAVFFSQDVLGKLADMGASIDVDFFYMN
jgi:hypothetical protein